MTKLFVGQPGLHRVCQKTETRQGSPNTSKPFSMELPTYASKIRPIRNFFLTFEPITQIKKKTSQICLGNLKYVYHSVLCLFVLAPTVKAVRRRLFCFLSQCGAVLAAEAAACNSLVKTANGGFLPIGGLYTNGAPLSSLLNRAS